MLPILDLTLPTDSSGLDTTEIALEAASVLHLDFPDTARDPSCSVSSSLSRKHSLLTLSVAQHMVVDLALDVLSSVPARSYCICHHRT